MPAKRIKRVEQAPERVVDFVRHAGGQLAENGVFFLFGKVGGKGFPFIEGMGHRR